MGRSHPRRHRQGKIAREQLVPIELHNRIEDGRVGQLEPVRGWLKSWATPPTRRPITFHLLRLTKPLLRPFSPGDVLGHSRSQTGAPLWSAHQTKFSNGSVQRRRSRWLTSRTPSAARILDSPNRNVEQPDSTRAVGNHRRKSHRGLPLLMRAVSPLFCRTQSWLSGLIRKSVRGLPATSDGLE